MRSTLENNMKIDIGKSKVLILQQNEIIIRNILDSRKLESQQQKIHSKIRNEIDSKIDGIFWINIMETIKKRRDFL